MVVWMSWKNIPARALKQLQILILLITKLPWFYLNYSQLKDVWIIYLNEFEMLNFGSIRRRDTLQHLLKSTCFSSISSVGSSNSHFHWYCLNMYVHVMSVWSLQVEENLGMVMIFTLVTAVQEKLNEIVDLMKNRIEEEKRRKEKEAEEAEKVGKRKGQTRSTVITAMSSAGGVPWHGGHHRELPGMESNIWPGNDWADEKKTEGGWAGQQGQTDW